MTAPQPKEESASVKPKNSPQVSPVRLVAPPATEGRPRITAEDRIQALKRGYQRELGRKPSTTQKQLMDRAALLSVKAEIAVYDPRTTANDVVRLDRQAQRARVEMRESFNPPPRADDQTPTLQQVLRS